ncbi:MAG: hypothetical protein AVDCRST_MAG20-305, partial [uncultured Acidimicrobiales bacterium]
WRSPAPGGSTSGTASWRSKRPTTTTWSEPPTSATRGGPQPVPSRSAR